MLGTNHFVRVSDRFAICDADLSFQFSVENTLFFVLIFLALTAHRTRKKEQSDRQISVLPW